MRPAQTPGPCSQSRALTVSQDPYHECSRNCAVRRCAPARSGRRAARRPAGGRGAVRRGRHPSLRMRRPVRLPPAADGGGAAGRRGAGASPCSRSAASCRCRSCRAAPAPGCRAARCRSPTACCCRWRTSTASCSIDPVARTAVVQPGVRNLAISEAAAPHGLYYAPDPSSQIACTIGGNVAENSGGVHCLKYGLTVHNVLRVRVPHHRGRGRRVRQRGARRARARPAGAVHRLRRHARRSSPKSPSGWCRSRSWRACIMASFDDVAEGGRCGGRVIAAGIIPAGLEMMDQTGIARWSSRSCTPATTSTPRRSCCANPTARASEVDEEIARMEAVLAQRRRHRASRCRSDEAERLRFWAGRKNAFPAVGRISPDYYCMDGTIPRKQPGAGAARHRSDMEAKYGLRCANVFHAGDGNLHPLILFDANQPGELAARRSVRRRDPRAVRARSAAPSPASMASASRRSTRCASQFDAAELDAFRAVKRAFDPRGLLNPGKAIPTLHRCAEYGRMHVQRRPAAVPRPAAVLIVDADPSTQLMQNQRRSAALPARERTLRIRGGGSKDFYGDAPRGRAARHARLYAASSATSPTELVITARCGTPLAGDRGGARRRRTRCWPSSRRISARKRHARRLRRGGLVGSAPRAASVGACAISCSARVLIDGRGEVLRFGGQVMKNVAGYDVSRAAGRLAGHAGPDPRSLAQGAAAAAREERTLRFEHGRGRMRCAR